MQWKELQDFILGLKAELIETIATEIVRNKNIIRSEMKLTPELQEKLVQATIEELREQEIIPAAPPELPERHRLRNGIEDKVFDFENARTDLIFHCFQLMLCEGISWRDIFEEIASAVPRNDRETRGHLKALESLTLTASDFS